jgi:predicted nucleic acid-binding protein
MTPLTAPVVLLDTNVVLDALLRREPFVVEAREIFQMAESGAIKAFVCATTLTTIDYLAAKAVGATKARKLMTLILSLCEVAPVTRAVLEDAIASSLTDFEDAVLCQAALASGLETIITRNGKDFRGCGLSVYSPREWLAASRH